MKTIAMLASVCALTISFDAAAAKKAAKKTAKKAAKGGNHDPRCSVAHDTDAGVRRYYLTTFGCNSTRGYFDSEDDCHPGCGASRGVCTAAEMADHTQLDRTYRMNGRTSHFWRGNIACEDRLQWFSTGGHQFGCGAKIRITNPANGKAVVAVVADSGPSCRVEQRRGVNHEVLDTSDAVSCCLFGSHHGAGEHKVVTAVSAAGAALGPVAGTTCLVCGHAGGGAKHPAKKAAKKARRH